MLFLLVFKEINMQDDRCKDLKKHPSRIESVRATMPGESLLLDASELFKVMGDPTRMRIITSLFKAELCVCDLSEIAGISQSAVSHQLRILRQARLVRYRREGKNAYYSLQDEHVRKLVAMAIEHVHELYAT